MSDQSIFHTRSKASKGRKTPLFTPDGEPTEHWLLIRGIDSDEFRSAEAAGKRAAIEIAQMEDLDEKAEAMRDEQNKVIAALIADWSFKSECTEENKVDFLKEAPQIADLVNKYAANRRLFFGKEPSNSASTQKQSSGSVNQKKGPRKARENT